jgi:EXS family
MSEESPNAMPFDGLFPLPFRVFFLAGLGILGWATNLHVLDSSGVDVVDALDLRISETSTSPRSMYRSPQSIKKSALYFPVYRLFFSYSIWCFGAWALFVYVVRGNVLFVDAFRHIPAICGILILFALVTQMDILQRRERDAFLL